MDPLPLPIVPAPTAEPWCRLLPFAAMPGPGDDDDDEDERPIGDPDDDEDCDDDDDDDDDEEPLQVRGPGASGRCGAANVL